MHAHAQVSAEGAAVHGPSAALFIPPIPGCHVALPDPGETDVLVLPKEQASRDRLLAVPLACWPVATCRHRPAADVKAAAGLQETGIVVMGAALFMSRWQQVGPCITNITYDCNQKPGSCFWAHCIIFVLHIKCSSCSTVPQKAPTLLAAFIARHYHVSGVEPLHHADAQVWDEAPQVRYPESCCAAAPDSPSVMRLQY